MFCCLEGAEEFSPRVPTLSFIHEAENGEYLMSVAYGSNANRLEAYPTLRCRVAAVMGLPHDLELSFNPPKSNVA
jgi:hypothetical protein